MQFEDAAGTGAFPAPALTDPDSHFSLVKGDSTNPVRVDRIVWFTNQAPNGQVDEAITYWNRTTNTQLLPGQYAVVGPRASTAIGSTTSTTPYGVPSPQRIQLQPSVNIYDANGTSVMPTNLSTVHPAIGIIAACKPPAAWGANPPAAPNGIGISVTEPRTVPGENYYPQPTQTNAQNGNRVDAYGDLNQGGAGRSFWISP